MQLGLYCHVPFCASTCDFCAFYQEKPRRGDLERYLQAMDLEFDLLPKGRVFNTVFWGGGTPGLLAAKDLEHLGRAMLHRLSQQPEEWTIEMAPSTVKEDKLSVLKDLGVTRISMGVQSFQPELLQSLGRLHSPKQVYLAWDRIQSAGFRQTNLDLIFAVPNQSLEQWQSDIREAGVLGPDHISTYCLTFEEDTALYIKLSEGKVCLDEEKEVHFYERGWQLLEELGYAQYEISNFAKPGRECAHNINTWRMQEWIGCGPSAASQYARERYQRPSNLETWASGMIAGEPVREEFIQLDERTLLADSIIFGLRMNKGVDLAGLREVYPNAGETDHIEALINRLESNGLAQREAHCVSLTSKGRLLADAIGSEVIECMKPDTSRIYA